MATHEFDTAQLPQRHIAARGVYGVGAILALAIAAYGVTFPWLLPGMTDAFHQRYLSMSQVLVSMHVLAAGAALLISPFQFWLYRRQRSLHRYLGRVYFVLVIIGSVGGYYMAWHAYGGWVSTLGLGILATIWWAFTLLAVVHARAGNFAAHRRWMIRSFALTYAAVTLRVMSPGLSMVLDDITQSQVVYWLSWTFNLAVAEYWIRWQMQTPLKSIHSL